MASRPASRATRTPATAKLGRAVALAQESGNEDTAKLLAKVVDVVDAATGTVRPEEEGRRRRRDGARHPVDQDGQDQEVSEALRAPTWPRLGARPTSAMPAGCASTASRACLPARPGRPDSAGPCSGHRRSRPHPPWPCLPAVRRRQERPVLRDLRFRLHHRASQPCRSPGPRRPGWTPVPAWASLPRPPRRLPDPAGGPGRRRRLPATRPIRRCASAIHPGDRLAGGGHRRPRLLRQRDRRGRPGRGLDRVPRLLPGAPVPAHRAGDAHRPPQRLTRPRARDRPDRPADRPRHLAPARRADRRAGRQLVGPRPWLIERHPGQRHRHRQRRPSPARTTATAICLGAWTVLTIRTATS